MLTAPPGYVLHHAVGGGEHPLLVDQHTSTVQLIALEQSHLPRAGASGTWDSINNLLPTLVPLACRETWRKVWGVSLRGGLSLQQGTWRQRWRETGEAERCGEMQRQEWTSIPREQEVVMERERETDAAGSKNPGGAYHLRGTTTEADGRDPECRRQDLGRWGTQRPPQVSEGSRKRQKSLVCWGRKLLGGGRKLLGGADVGSPLGARRPGGRWEVQG